MNTFDDNELLLYELGELSDERAREIRLAVQDDPQLKSRLDELAATLDVMDHFDVPERDADYGRRVWARLEPNLHDEPWYARAWQSLASPVAAGLVVMAVAVGVSRWLPEESMEPKPQPAAVTADNAITARDRVLLASVSRHVEGSERFIRELNNRVAADLDTEEERQWAEVLLMANRLYRYAAERSNQPRIAQLLADMEPVLIEMANNDNGLSDEEFNALRQRINDNDLVLRLRGFNQGVSL